MLTRKQQQLLFFIHASIKKTGISPSFDEMKDALGLASKSGIHRLVKALEERGFIRRLPNRARALDVIRLPQQVFSPSFIADNDKCRQTDDTISGDSPHIRMAEQETMLRSVANSQENSVIIPLMGRIAAGVPISAIQHKTDNLSCPAFMIGKGEHYALKIRGDSMVNAGILDDDIVIINRTNTAHLGEIVVALIDDTEATLKRYRRRGDSVALESANPAYETRIFGPDRIKVQGKLVGLLRHY